MLNGCLVYDYTNQPDIYIYILSGKRLHNELENHHVIAGCLVSMIPDHQSKADLFGNPVASVAHVFTIRKPTERISHGCWVANGHGLQLHVGETGQVAAREGAIPKPGGKWTWRTYGTYQQNGLTFHGLEMYMNMYMLISYYYYRCIFTRKQNSISIFFMQIHASSIVQGKTNMGFSWFFWHFRADGILGLSAPARADALAGVAFFTTAKGSWCERRSHQFIIGKFPWWFSNDQV